MFGSIDGMRNCRQGIAVVLAATLIGGCATKPAESSYVVAQPQQAPIQTVTNFTESLRCMDDMFLRRSYNHEIPISSAGIPDQTGKITAGTRDMLISAISAMSSRSRAFRYIDFDPGLAELFGKPGERVMSRGLFVRGGVSELDQGIVEENSNGGISVAPVAGLGLNKQQLVSLMTVDMSLGDVSSQTILPGTSVSNTLAIARRSKGADLDGRINSVGIHYGISMTEQEGSHAGLRTLVELTALEMIGRYTKVPYWECLGLAGTDPRAKQIAYDQYSSMRDDERIAFVSAALKSNGYYSGPKVTAMTPDLRAAAARYQQENNQPAMGLLSFELYYALLGTPGAIAPPLPALTTPVVAAHVDAAAAPFVTLSRESFNRAVVYEAETIRFTADLARDGYMACFYQDGDTKVFRTYPNPTQPSEFVAAGRKVVVPGAGDYFRIRPTTVGTKEQFTCFAASKSILAALPENLSRPVLKPLPVDSINALGEQLKSVLGGVSSASNVYAVAGDPKH